MTDLKHKAKVILYDWLATYDYIYMTDLISIGGVQKSILFIIKSFF